MIAGTDPLFLTLDEVLEIHAQQIELHGGSEGIRDAAGLESAVATPMATFDGEFLHSLLASCAENDPASRGLPPVKLDKSWLWIVPVWSSAAMLCNACLQEQ